MSADIDASEDCAGACGLPASRRRLLRDAFIAGTAVLIAVGTRSMPVLAMPLHLIEGSRGPDVTVAYAIPAADGVQIDKKHEVILVRWQGMVYAFNLSCPHQNTALRWDDHDNAFSCPTHHSGFEPNGDYVEDSGHATRNMDRFAIVRDGAGVRVDLDKLYEADKDTAEWTSATVKIA